MTTPFEPSSNVTFDEYMTNRRLFGHIGTWCVWNGGENSNYITVDSEQQYDERLGETLHKRTVVLAYNFGTSASWAGVPESERLAILQQNTPFANMYGAMRPYYGEAFSGTALWGSYATDLFKYADWQTADEAPVGVPSRTADEMPDWYLSEEGLALQVEGLKHELDSLGFEDDPVFVFAIQKLNDPRIIAALRKTFPNMRYGTIYHYQYQRADRLRAQLPEQVRAIEALLNNTDSDKSERVEA